MSTKQNNNVLAIGVMFALFFIVAFVTSLASCMGVVVTNHFGASPAESQLGALANFIAYLCMGMPAGILLKRKGYKFTSLAAIVIGFTGITVQLLSGYAESFSVYVLGAFIAGFSMCMLNLVVNPTLNILGGGGNTGNRLVQFGSTFNSLGVVIAPVLLGYLIGGSIKDATVSKASPIMYIAMVIYILAFIIISVTKIPEPHMETAEEKAKRLLGNAPKDPHSPFSFRHFVFGIIAVFFYVGIEVSIPNMANVYLSGLDWVGPVIAGTMVSVYGFLMMCGRLMGGVIGGKVSSRAMLTTATVTGLIFTLCIIYIPSGIRVAVPFTSTVLPLCMIFATLCGLCTSIMWGSIFNLATEGLGKYTPMASGIFMSLVCGGGIVPYLQGHVASAIGFTASYWVVIFGFAVILLFALAGYKNVNKDIEVE